MTTLSTHVLDAALGVPAAGLAVVLSREGLELERATTDDDGRVAFTTRPPGGECALTFATGAWFAAAGRTAFHPQVDVALAVDPDEEHLHVALLLSPFAYTTYRGS
ncbi:hydroxyisourate hydrolase [Nocardioides sp. 31GB23]|uniref:hydroxyisourate hydrolase n=1 Tax=Nocardioides sp. 31GB23 TaxID=3156065 RepID=UPI0032AF9785